MIEREEVEKLSALSRITFEEEEIETLQKDIGAILEYVKVVEKAGVSADELHIGDMYNITREDENPHVSGVFTEDILNVAPRREGNYIKVKRILA